MKVGIVVQDAHENPPEMWLLEDIQEWASFLKANTDDGEVMTVTYREFSDEEVKKAHIAGKYESEGSEALTEEEKKILGVE